MISFQEKERLIKIVNQNFDPQKSELGRAGYCVVTGYYDGKSLQEVCSYYQLSSDNALHWWKYFGFNSSMAKPVQKKKRKQSDIFDYLKTNVGENITVKDLIDNCSISSPTAYKFINENAGWFKKTRRGVYEVVDADEERKKAKATR